MSESILQEAERLVNGDRQTDYGHPIEDFRRTAQMWSAILGADVEPQQVGLCMMAVKISRQCNRPKRDNLVDAAGYAETVDMVIQKLAEEGRLNREGRELRLEPYRCEPFPYGSLPNIK